MTQKEWFDFCNEDSNRRTCLRIEEREKERKETAEKIYKLVDNKLDLYRNGVIGGSLYDSGYQTAIYDIKRSIKEQFGVEIKE